MATQKILLIALLFMAFTVVIYCRPMIDTSDIVKDIRDIENILNESDTDTSDDDEDDEEAKDSNTSDDADNDDKGDDKGETTSNESSDAAPKDTKDKNSTSEEAPIIRDVTNDTSTDTNTTTAESAPSVGVNSNTTDNTTAAVSEKPSTDTVKTATSRKDHIGIGQRLTSEQKDEEETPVSPPNEFAQINPAEGTPDTPAPSDAAPAPPASAVKGEKAKDTPAPEAEKFEKSKESSSAVEDHKEEMPKGDLKVHEKAPVTTEEKEDNGKVNDLKEASPQASPQTAPKEEEEEEGKSQKKDVEEVAAKPSVKVVANKTKESEDDDDDDNEGDDEGENISNEKPVASTENSEATSEEETDDSPATVQTERSKIDDAEQVTLQNEDDRVKMFFISPYEREEAASDGVETASVRQILTYPATSGHGWGHSHQWGPSHIWNSDYPYYAYGYSWGCGAHNDGGAHGGHGSHDAMKKSNLKAKAPGKDKSESKSKSIKKEKGKGKEKASKAKKVTKKSEGGRKTDWICRDYMLVPATPRGPLLDPDVVDIQRGTARQNVYSKDIACNEDDQQCKQRQVIGSMAGGSLFGDGMGGLGMGFPGVPGIHAGLSGYNEMGGFGDHEHACHGGHCATGFGGGYGGGGGPVGPVGHFVGTPDREMSNFWGERQNVPQYVGRTYEMENSVKKSSNPKKSAYDYSRIVNGAVSNVGNVGYEAPGFNSHAAFNGGAQYNEGYSDDHVGGLRKFDTMPNGVENQNYFGSQGWGNSGGAFIRQQGNEFNNWGPGIPENAENSFIGAGGYNPGNGENNNNVIDNYFGGKDVPTGTPYIGNGNDYGIGRTVHSVMNAENQGKLGLQGKISINGIHKNFSYKSKIRKHKDHNKEKTGNARQDIAMPDEQAMMEITKQRQLIGSLGASTLFADNVGGMGLGHPGVPQMSSGISGIPGEYGGTGGYSHGWNGEDTPGVNPHGFAHYAYGNRDLDRDHEREPVYQPQQSATDSGHRRTQILAGDVDYAPRVSQQLMDATQASQMSPQNYDFGVSMEEMPPEDRSGSVDEPEDHEHETTAKAHHLAEQVQPNYELTDKEKNLALPDNDDNISELKTKAIDDDMPEVSTVVHLLHGEKPEEVKRPTETKMVANPSVELGVEPTDDETFVVQSPPPHIAASELHAFPAHAPTAHAAAVPAPNAHVIPARVPAAAHATHVHPQTVHTAPVHAPAVHAMAVHRPIAHGVQPAPAPVPVHKPAVVSHATLLPSHAVHVHPHVPAIHVAPTASAVHIPAKAVHHLVKPALHPFHQSLVLSNINDSGADAGYAKEEPLPAKEEPLEVKEETVEAKAEPLEAKEESVEAKEETIEAKAEPLEAKEEPLEMKAEPIEAKAEAIETKAEPLEAKEEPLEAKPEPFEAKEEPLEAKEEPLEAKAEPIEGKAESLEAKPEEPIEAKAEAVEAKEESIEAKAEPLEAKAEPLEAKAESIEAKAEPIESKAESVEAKEAPIEAKAEAVEPKAVPVKTKTHHARPIELKEDELEAKDDGIQSIEAKEVPIEAKTESIAAKPQAKAKTHKVKAKPIEAKAESIELKAEPIESKEDYFLSPEDDTKSVEAKGETVEAKDDTMKATEIKEEPIETKEEEMKPVEFKGDNIAGNLYATEAKASRIEAKEGSRVEAKQDENEATNVLVNSIVNDVEEGNLGTIKIKPVQQIAQEAEEDTVEAQVKTLTQDEDNDDVNIGKVKAVLKEDIQEAANALKKDKKKSGKKAALEEERVTKAEFRAAATEAKAEEKEAVKEAANVQILRGEDKLSDREREQLIAGLQAQEKQEKAEAKVIAAVLKSKEKGVVNEAEQEDTVNDLMAKHYEREDEDAEGAQSSTILRSNVSSVKAPLAESDKIKNVEDEAEVPKAVINFNEEQTNAHPASTAQASAPHAASTAAVAAAVPAPDAESNATDTPVPTDAAVAEPASTATAPAPSSAPAEEVKAAELPHPTTEESVAAGSAAAVAKDVKPTNAKTQQPHHVHVGVGTGDVKVEVETSKSIIAKHPTKNTKGSKMSEIERMVHDVSDSIDRTNKKLQAITASNGKRQITPAFTPVVSEPAAVPDIRYPVPAADRYPLGAGYIWPSANYGHQLGGPFAWSKSSTPTVTKKGEKSKAEKKSSKDKVEKKESKSKVESRKHKKGIKDHSSHLKKERRSADKANSTRSEKIGTKRQFLAHPYERSNEGYPYHGGMPIYGSGMGYPMSHGAGFTGHAGTQRAFTRHFHTMGDVGGGFGGGYQGGFHGGYGHRLRASHSFLPTLSGRYSNFATHEAGGGYGGGIPMSLHHQSLFNGGGGGAGGGGGGGAGYDGGLHGMMGGHDAGGMMGGRDGGELMSAHDGGGLMGGHDGGALIGAHDGGGMMPAHDVGGQGYALSGHSAEGGYGSMAGLGGGLAGYAHSLGGGMIDDHQGVPEGSQLPHGYSHGMQFAMPPDDSHSGYISRHNGYGGSIGGPVPGGFETGSGTLSGGMNGLGAGVSGLVSGGQLSGSLDQGYPPGASHAVDGGYGGGGEHLSGFGRQSLDQQQPDQTSGDPSSFAPMIHNQMPQGLMPQMVPEPQQAMFSPNPLTPYGNDIRGMDYPMTSKRASVPKHKPDKETKRKVDQWD